MHHDELERIEPITTVGDPAPDASTDRAPGAPTPPPAGASNAASPVPPDASAGGQAPVPADASTGRSSPVAADTSSNHPPPVPADTSPGHPQPVLSDTSTGHRAPVPAATPHRRPDPSASHPDALASARSSLLAAYGALLDQIRDLARGDRSDRVAQLAEAAAALVEGEFARRLVFDTGPE